MNAEATTGYRHTQKAPWYLLLLVIGVGCLVVAWLLREMPLVSVLLGLVGAGMLVLATSFRELTVADEGDCLAIWFGPLPLFSKRVRYVDMRSVEVGRTLLLDGWGIHYSVRGGWVWNLWGRRCVVIHNNGTIRVGTDDAENLVRFLKSRLTPVIKPAL